MIAQRPSGAAPVARARAEALPLEDNSVDAAMAILSDHHWEDRPAGLREMMRVARWRVVIFTWDRSHSDGFWLTRDYLPGFNRLSGMTVDHAWWRRPEAYLDGDVRANISIFWRLEPEEVSEAMARLRDDLSSGRWHERNGELLELSEVDFGHVLLVRQLA